MKRNHKQIITGVVILLSIWIVIRWTGMFSTYKVPTSSNEPAFYPGDWIYVSNLFTPDLLDFICIENSKGEVFIYRLCGQAGDQVELRGGVLYVNGKNKDAGLRIKGKNTLSEQQLEFFQSTEGILHKSFPLEWNMFNFGPITVPKKHIFLLGDNRFNASDSRIIGFVSEDKIVGTVLNN